MGANKDFTSSPSGNTFTVKDSSGKMHTIHKLTIEEFCKYIDERTPPDSDFIKKYGVHVYVTKEGKAIVEESGNYAIYPSVPVLIDTISRISSRPTSLPIFYNRNPYGEDFPLHASKIVENLYTEFGINNAKVKSHEELINFVDEIVIKKRSIDFFDRHYLSFVAFVGELIIKRFGATWKMVLSDDGQTWTPILTFFNKDVHFVDFIQEDVNNLNEDHPLQQVYEFIGDIFRIK